MTQAMQERNNAPVFVMGCHRSGTNLLYDMLMSAGEFARYPDNLYVYQTLIPRFGDFSSRSNRQALMEIWLRSKSFQRSGLDAEEIKSKILEECNSGGDFYRIVMGEIVRKQNAARWAAYGPDNVFYMPDIHHDVPEALFVHIIRDGRDVAFGLSKKEWIPSLPWDRQRRFLVMGAFWKWTVTKARRNGRKMASNYTEVHFEDLILHPRETLARLGKFLGQELDYDRIRQHAVGTVARPNSSHQQESPADGFSPASRWKQQVDPEDVSSFEALYGDLLEELGYETTSNGARRSPRLSGRLIRAFYPFFFESKLQLKNQTSLGRFSSLFPLQLQ